MNNNKISNDASGASRYVREAKIRHIKDISQRQINKLRMEFSEKFLSSDFKINITEDYIRDFLERIEKNFATSPQKQEVFDAHRENFEHFIKTGSLKRPLTLNSDASTLYWGAVLSLLAVHPEIQQDWDEKNRSEDISKSMLWRSIASSSYMKNQLAMHAWHVARSIDNPDAKIVYGNNGYPNISYCFVPSQNMIIDDMLWTMITGVEAAATAINHEIAHSQGSKCMSSPKMDQIRKEQDRLVDELKMAIRDGDEERAKRLNIMAIRRKIEYEYRFRFLDELENMFANRYAVTLGGEFDGAKLNELETVINLGKKYSHPKTIIEAKKEFDKNVNARIQHVKDLARNTFFAGNGIIDGYDYNDFIMLADEWHSVGLYPELLTGVDKNGDTMTYKECCEELCRICKEFEQQPSKTLKYEFPLAYKRRMETMSKKRAEMLDEFFDMFIEPHMDDLYIEAEKNLDNFMKDLETKGIAQERGKGGENTLQSGRQPQSNDGDGNGDGNGGSGKSEDSNENNDSNGNGDGNGGSGKSEDSNENNDSKENEDKSKDGDGNGNSDGNGGERDGESQDDGNSDQGGDGGENSQNDQQSQDKDWENPVDNPDKLRIPERKSYGEELSKEQIEELLKKSEIVQELKEEYERNNKEEIEKKNNFEKEQEEKNTKEDKEAKYNVEEILLGEDSVNPRKRSVDDMSCSSVISAMRGLLKADRNAYEEYISKYSGEIKKAKKIIKEILMARKLDSIRRGNGLKKLEHTLLPVQGGHTIDRRKSENLLKRIKSGDRNINMDDFNLFKTKYKCSLDEIIEKEEISASNFGILIDSSGSMTMGNGAFEKALAISCILYEASKDFDELGVYIYLMGADEPFVVATPKDKSQVVAERFSQILEGRSGSADRILPAMHQFLMDLSDDMAKKPNKMSGYTHIFSLTDGVNQEYYSGYGRETNEALAKMIMENEHLTYDTFAIESSWRERAHIIETADELKEKGINRMDYVEVKHCESGDELGELLSEKIYELMMKRIKHNEVVKPKPNKVKRKLIDDNVITLEGADSFLTQRRKNRKAKSSIKVDKART